MKTLFFYIFNTIMPIFVFEVVATAKEIKCEQSAFVVGVSSCVDFQAVKQSHKNIKEAKDNKRIKRLTILKNPK